ncbi:FecR domain-containing protein (plasmid) [Asticcacaulis sp. DW145]|uniref:FecR family protein n=1 Tax=Asticcacaulis sp. DW145 TaxID=3095608 RepID=UPI0030938184|nr:FecR domain-containing protein [Asticcacaulis sp. DW145]
MTDNNLPETLDLEPGHRQMAIRWCVRLSEGPLGADEGAEFSQWLTSDPLHLAEFEKALAVWDGLGAAAAEPEFIRHREKSLGHYRRAQARRWKTASIGRWLLPLVLAAVFALAIMAARPSVVGKPYLTQTGERRIVNLEDGSRVALDADTEVRVSYDAYHRNLTLVKGRASFTVAKDASRPFSVSSGQKTIVATGTAFSVERLKDEIRVILYEGHVRVLTANAIGSAPQMAETRTTPRAAETLLTPGKQMVLRTETNLALIRDAVELTPRAWETGQLEFVDEPLAVAVERVNRYTSSRRIIVADDAAEIPISGVFNAGEVDAFAQGVASAFPVKIEEGDNKIKLLRK